MTTTATIPLSPAEKRIAEYLIGGARPGEIAAQTHLSPHTVKNHLRVLRRKVRCPHRCSLPVLVHALLTSRQIAPPTPVESVPDLGPEQRLLLRAVAHRTGAYDIAEAAQIVPADVRANVEALVAGTGAHDAVHLVVLAHGWGLLGQERKVPFRSHERRVI
ncbi:helix-turn-helix transcriptional regulator [Streptomyces sp. NPDC000618]|uniref:helix-turn-helix transcriptional regulator n=1 Tax=Streptomyces sp. NPDC000618 TaxID=3154265 RepID=UPI0033285274